MVAPPLIKQRICWAATVWANCRHWGGLRIATPMRLFSRGLLVLLLTMQISDNLAQPQNQGSSQPWQFRPVQPSNARGAPPWQQTPYPAGQPPITGTSPESRPGYGQPASGQMQPESSSLTTPWPQGQYPQAQFPPAQPPGGYPQQPFGGTPPDQYPRAAYPGAGSPGSRPAAPQYPPNPYQSQQFRQFAQPSYGSYSQPARIQMLSPRLEVELADERPYVQENVLVRLRVISSGNLATASPDLSAIDEVLFQKIDGPKTSTRGSGNNREIVNEFVMVMTPLRAGELEVGPIKVTGTIAGDIPFDAVARQPLRLQVRPPVAAVRPWLPLQTLRIKAELEDGVQIERGRPVTLMLELEAQGALGDQLPSLESMLRSDDFSVYREQTMTDSRLNASGNTLIGKRIEYYTLVPQTGGRLQLPQLRLGWWNVDTATREASSVPIRTISVAGEPGPFGFGDSREPDDGANRSLFWLPIAGLLLLLIGYWGGVWLRNRPNQTRAPAARSGSAPKPLPWLSRLRSALTGITSNSLRAIRTWVHRSRPTPLLRRAQRVLAQLRPKSARVYQCAMAANNADDPAAWCLAFQQQACRNLQASAREPLPRMADRIVDLRPGADRQRVLQLMQQLDSALYNRQEIDFTRWKRDFRHALRPGTGVLRGLVAGQVRHACLPALNPQPQR